MMMTVVGEISQRTREGTSMRRTCDPALLSVLETMIAPGGRMRLSPYVESAQFQVLFGERPCPDRRHESGLLLLKRHNARIKQMAHDWVQFSNGGKSFDSDYYDSSGQLDAYLTYYCTTNVAKVQLCLLDLLRAGTLPQPHLRIIDIGVGTATSLLGVMDFLLTWATACALYDDEFPIEDVQFIGIDRSQNCLDYSSRVAQAFADAIQERLDALQNADGIPALRNVERWARTAQWKQHDLNIESFDYDAPNLLIASNSFNELQKTGRRHLESAILSLSVQGVAIIIEPGDRKKSQDLMNWRYRLVKTHPSMIRVMGPCGHTRSSPLTEACSTCWNGRRESLHQPLLYKQFRLEVAALKGGDNRPFDDFENKLLSWTYTLLQKNEGDCHDQERIRIQDSQTWPDEVSLVFVGTFSSKKQVNGRNGIDDAQDDWLTDRYQDDGSDDARNGASQYFKFCPGIVAQARQLTLRRDAGIEIPPLLYGDEIIVKGARAKKASETAIEIETSADTHIQPCSPNIRVRDTFLDACSERTRVALDEIGYRLFGFPQMHAFQHRILARVLTGRSILGIAATGSGKSECYILPAMLFPGITIVVSPLKSLMTDQYDQRICQRYGLGNLSTFINGDVPFHERQRRLRHIEQGHYKLVYVTPEQIDRSYVLTSLQRANRKIGIRYLALDEAHCISQWGHDFRSSYLNIVHRLRDRGIQPVRIALTATASPEVRQDLCEELDLNPAPLDQGGDVYIQSSNRPELNLIVRICHTTDEKVNAIISDLVRLQEINRRNSEPGAAIVFLPWTGGRPDNGAFNQPAPASNQTGGKPGLQHGRLSAGVTQFASYLERTLKEPVAIYHGKMDGDDPKEGEETQDAPDVEQANKSRSLGDMSGRTRAQQQHAFMTGKCNIMVATKGFGMGIDKPNIRLVIHRTPPANLEAYAQEAGRAGRDRQQADVILYYSPDEPKDAGGFGAKSDRQIQELFLSEKYIRREDVIVMRVFLRSVTRKVANRLYFTNDEAIAFFDDCVGKPQIAGLRHGYRWPSWPERLPSGHESREHKEILDRGYEYKCKTDYIKRILDVLYRIRPTNDAKVREALILELRQCGGAIIEPFIRNVNAIFRSNAYFGELLRKSGITPDEFEQLYMAGDLTPLAKRLDMTLSDLEQMIHDIRQSERPELLRGWVVAPWYGPATGRTSLKEWRDYAGAYKRASKRTADDRAKAEGRSQPTLNDWFGWSETCSRYGWEVLGGPALEREDDFADYLDLFMALHDRRRANDWASYNRLLTDYVGVQEDGSIGSTNGKECLRAVLLGYLKTYEVVVGGNCYSCSRCVSDGNFAKFDMEQRRRAVARMTEDLERLFTQLEGSNDCLPDEQTIDRLLSAIRHEQASGSSLSAYLQGWTARLLQDTPNHQAALLIRAVAKLEGLFTLQRGDLLNVLQTLVNIAAIDESRRIDRLLSQARQHLSDSSEFHSLRAAVARRLNDPEKELDAWTEVLRILEQSAHTSQHMRYAAHCELMRLYGPESPLHDQSRCEEHARHAVRCSPDISSARTIYASVMSGWKWSSIAEELDCISQDGRTPAHAQALLLSWLAAQPDERAGVVATYLSESLPLLQTWSVDAIESIIRLFPESLLRQHPRILLHVAPARPAWHRIYINQPQAAISYLAECQRGSDTAKYAIDCLHVLRTRHKPTVDAIYARLKPRFTRETRTAHGVMLWCKWFEVEILAEPPEYRLDLLKRSLDLVYHGRAENAELLDFLRCWQTLLPQTLERRAALQRLLPLVRKLSSDPQYCEEANRLWGAICSNYPVYVPGDRVQHPSFGFGRVIRVFMLVSMQTPAVSVEFDQAGIKEISLQHAGIGIVEFVQE